MEFWDAHRPHITAALAASQVSPVPFLPFSEPAPFRLLEDRLGDRKASPPSGGRGYTFPRFQLKGKSGDSSEPVAVRCDGDFQGSPDEVSMSQGHAKANSSLSPLQSIKVKPHSAVESNNPSGTDEKYESQSKKSLGHSSPIPDASTPAVSASAEPEKPASSAAGLQHLLNPVAADATEKTSRRRNADHFDMPQKPYAGTPQMPPATIRASPGAVTLPSITPPPISSYPDLARPGSRRTLTPGPSSTYNTAPTVLGAPAATIDAKKSPFGASRDNAISHDYPRRRESSVGAMGAGLGYPFVNPAAAQSPSGRRASMGSSMDLMPRQSSVERRVSVGGISQIQTSQSDSPSTTYSSYSQFSHTPPVPLPNLSGHPSSSAGYFPSTYTVTGGGGGGLAGGYPSSETHAKEAFSPRTTSLGPNTYHLMTLNTEQGPIQVPVDVQAASKVADEKRKRNATASHRFRQRRKEKERETSQNIAKLEHEARELREEKEFYRMERDFFRSVVKSMPGQPPIGPRPTSPRLLRLAPQGAPTGGYPNPQWPPADDSSRTARNTRRRTSSYVPPPGLVPPPANVPPLPTGPPAGLAPAPPGRHIPMAPSSSGTGDAGNRPRLPGPGHMTVGPFDPSAGAGYDNSWKPGP